MGESWRLCHDGSLAIRDLTEETRRSAGAAQVHAGMLRFVRKCSMRAEERAVQAAQSHAGNVKPGQVLRMSHNVSVLTCTAENLAGNGSGGQELRQPRCAVGHDVGTCSAPTAA